MSKIPPCPVCGTENSYPDGICFICSDCAHEWSIHEDKTAETSEQPTVKDANNNILHDGDDVIVIKDLKVKGSSIVIKKGTKIKNIRLSEGNHNIDCKVEGVSLALKSEFMKKT